MIERAYPGVHLSEVAGGAKPIEGVPVGTSPTQTSAQRNPPPSAAPDWTQHNSSDPGVTLVELLAWLGDLELFRATPEHHAAHALAPWGVVQGLAVDEGKGASGVSVAPGSASAADGQPVTTDSSTHAHRRHKP